MGIDHDTAQAFKVWHTRVMAGAVRAIVFALCREDENMKPH